jgi:hypothetical protein
MRTSTKIKLMNENKTSLFEKVIQALVIASAICMIVLMTYGAVALSMPSVCHYVAEAM